MSIITFISDFGMSDHYVSSVKASILRYNSSNQIIDISHDIKKYDLSHAAHVFKNVFKIFPGKYMGEIASKLASGINYTTLGKPLLNYKRFLDREISLSKGKIIGYVMRIDTYGNLITNINKKDFNNSLNKSSGSFIINLGIDKISKISENYSDVSVADLFAVFNYNGFLEIGMNGGGASELLGIKNHSPITIKFL